jgi:O-antigen/teichoic acid export membrane protein
MSLKRNIGWNLAGTGLPLLLGIVTIPYLIGKIGVEAFGVITLVWALIGYFSLFDFGLGRALTQQVSAARSSRLDIQIPSLVVTGLWFTAITGIIGAGILAVLASQLAQHWLNISLPLQASAESALLIAAIGIPLTTVTTGLRGVLEAYEDFKTVNLLRIVLGAANFGLPALSVMFISDSLAWMVVGLIVARIVVMLAHVWVLYQKLPSGWAAARFSNKQIRKLLSFGMWMTLSNIIGPLMVTADRFLISAVLGAGVVAYYTVPFEGLIRILALPGALSSALFPRLTAVITTDINAASHLYSKCLKLTTFVLSPICLLVAIGSKWGLTLWLGESFASQSWMIVCVMAVGILFNGIAHVPFAAIQSSGDARTTASLHFIELIVYIPVLYFCMKSFGLIGAAVAWSARAALDLTFLLIYAKNKDL